MKKVFFSFLCLLLLTGCSIKKSEDVNNHIQEENKSLEIVEEIPKYTDNNNTPIAIYNGNGNTLNKVTIYQTKLVPLEDINIFQIFPSQENQILLDKKFGLAFYEEWSKYNTSTFYKIGYNVKFTDIEGNNISYNILNPSMTNDIYSEYLLLYLYDDYYNLGKNWYSHIEPSEYKEDTLFTSIKIQAGGHSFKINSKIQLTVFTYDGLDDFNESGEYRGNSSYQINICVEGLEC